MYDVRYVSKSEKPWLLDLQGSSMATAAYLSIIFLIPKERPPLFKTHWTPMAARGIQTVVVEPPPGDFGLNS